MATGRTTEADEGAARARGRSRAGREQAQRGLLLAAMAEAVGAKGYEASRVEDAIELAGLSRSTFYKHFENKEECFIAAFDAAVETMVERIVEAAQGESAYAERVAAGLRALVELLACEPGMAHLVTIEIRAAGKVGQERYREALHRFARLLERADAAAGGKASPSDLALLVVGGVAAAIAQEIAAGRVARLAELTPELLPAALVPPAELRGRPRERAGNGAKRRVARRVARPAKATNATRPRPKPARKRSGRAPVPESLQRAGLCAAMFEVAARRGYDAATIDEAVRLSGFGKLVYYKIYGTKEACFLAAAEERMEAVLARIEEAISDKAGGARLEAGLRALLELLASEPALAWVTMVEARVAGAPCREAQLRWLDRLAELIAKSSEGAERAWLRRMGLGAVATIVALEIEAGRTGDLPARLPELCFVVLAPCLGAERAAGAVGLLPSAS